MTAQEPAGGSRRRPRGGLLLAALFVAALSLRPQLIGVGPLLPRIQAELATPHGVVGLLSTIPVLCMGLFAPPAAFVSNRLGPRRAITVCLFAIALFGLVRAMAPGTALLLLATFAVGVPVGVAGALLPVAVKAFFPHRPVAATGVYAAGIQLGATGSALLAVPAAHSAGGWRGALALFGAFGLVLALVWPTVTRRMPRAPSATRPPRLPLRSSIAWLITALFFLQSVPYYGLNAWMPAHLGEAGWSEAAAGGLLSLTNLTALLATLLLPAVADRHGSRRSYLTGAALLAAAGTAGLVLQPGLAPLWAVAAGLALGTLFPIVLTLPLDVTDDPAAAGAVAGLMFGAGYTLSALTPSLLGFVRDASGSFAASLWLVAGASLVLATLALTLSPARLHRRAGLAPAPPP